MKNLLSLTMYISIIFTSFAHNDPEWFILESDARYYRVRGQSAEDLEDCYARNLYPCWLSIHTTGYKCDVRYTHNNKECVSQRDGAWHRMERIDPTKHLPPPPPPGYTTTQFHRDTVTYEYPSKHVATPNADAYAAPKHTDPAKHLPPPPPPGYKTTQLHQDTAPGYKYSSTDIATPNAYAAAPKHTDPIASADAASHGHGYTSFKFREDTKEQIRKAWNHESGFSTLIFPGIVNDVQTPKSIIAVTGRMYGFQLDVIENDSTKIPNYVQTSWLLLDAAPTGHNFRLKAVFVTKIDGENLYLCVKNDVLYAVPESQVEQRCDYVTFETMDGSNKQRLSHRNIYKTVEKVSGPFVGNHASKNQYVTEQKMTGGGLKMDIKSREEGFNDPKESMVRFGLIDIPHPMQAVDLTGKITKPAF